MIVIKYIAKQPVIVITLTITIWIFKLNKSEGIELKKEIHFWYDNLTRNKNIGDNYFDLYTFNDLMTLYWFVENNQYIFQIKENLKNTSSRSKEIEVSHMD